MRDELAKLVGHRGRFAAEFVRFGTRPRFRPEPVTTVCLQNVVDLSTGDPVADHIWMTAGHAFQSLGELEAGLVLAFDARVSWWSSARNARNVG